MKPMKPIPPIYVALEKDCACPNKAACPHDYTVSARAVLAFNDVRLTKGAVGALYEAYFVAELLLSGRLVPMAILPGWAQTLAWLLPFQWTFGYPITALVGPITTAELFVGLAMQALWIALGALAVRLVWAHAVRHFTAVGG